MSQPFSAACVQARWSCSREWSLKMHTGKGCSMALLELSPRGIELEAAPCLQGLGLLTRGAF